MGVRKEGIGSVQRAEVGWVRAVVVRSIVNGGGVGVVGRGELYAIRL